jgi:PAS domain S-box-containing protein
MPWDRRIWWWMLACCFLYVASGLLWWKGSVFWEIELATHAALVVIPAWRFGRRGAWEGALLSASSRLAGELVYYRSVYTLGHTFASAADSAVWGAGLALVIGEVAAAIHRGRRTSDALQAFTRDVLTTADPEAVLARVLDGAREILGADGVAVWIRRGTRDVCLAAAGTLSAYFSADIPAGDLEQRPAGHLLPGGLSLSVPMTALGERIGVLAVTRPSTAVRSRVPDRVRSAAAALAEAAALAYRHATTAREARRSEHRFRGLFQSLPSGVFVTDRAGRVVLANEAAATLFRRSAAALAATALPELLVPAAWETLRGRIAEPRPGIPVRADVHRLDGSVARVHWVFGSHTEGDDVWTLAYCWDAEEQLQREEETTTLAAAMRSLQEGVVLVDLEGRIRFANPAACQIYGYADAAAMRGRSLVEHVPPDDLAGFAARMETARRTGWHGELTIVRADAGAVPVRVTTSPVRVDGAVIGTVGVLSDLTQQQEIERRAATSDKLATLGRLVAGAAHEINNPLAAILANAELLRVGGQTDESLDVIVNESRRAGRIVRDLLSFARQQPVARRPLDLRALVCDVLALRTGYQKASGIQITLASDGPEVAVHADADQLKQVLLNLVVNAEDALKGRPHRRLAVNVARAGQTALVTVDDSGAGVPEPLRARIFDPFFTTKPQGQGTGLGLSVSYGIVKEHGGHVWVESSPLGGARFVIQLPLAPADAATEDTPLPRTSDPARGAEPRRVLVVDDEEPIRRVAQRILSRFGHTVEIAESGREALAVLRAAAGAATPFDVIICDLRMPEMSGAELYHRLVREDLLGGARFAVATGDIADAGSAAFVGAGGFPVLLKPFELVGLLDVVSAAAPAMEVVAA